MPQHRGHPFREDGGREGQSGVKSPFSGRVDGREGTGSALSTTGEETKAVLEVCKDKQGPLALVPPPHRSLGRASKHLGTREQSAFSGSRLRPTEPGPGWFGMTCPARMLTARQCEDSVCG